jgi:WD40 repeat protein
MKDNPYVGPRAFKPGETLYGRDRETDELIRLLTVDRIVLLYATSGAGKTSLVQAKLTKRLEDEGFHVLPVARLSNWPLKECLSEQANRYVCSLLYDWESGHPQDEPALADFSGIELHSYLSQRSWLRMESKPKVIIIDQFEEILTLDQADVKAKVAFFEQLGRALEDHNLWALFAMREEYSPGLDAYRELIPTSLSSRYRLELLQHERAIEAIRCPAVGRQVEFTEDAAQKLLQALTTVRETGQGDQEVTRRVPFVDPLHLQIVCERRWERLPEGTQTIRPEDIDATTNVDDALKDYYSGAVNGAAARHHLEERFIRQWFDQRLISPQGLRLQVQGGAVTTAGLTNEVINTLVDVHLVRADQRQGAVWYEIAHDRLVNAILDSNRPWYEQQLPPWQLRAIEWSKFIGSGEVERAREELVTGNAFDEAYQWAQQNRRLVTATDWRFLDACQERRDQEKKDLVQREREENNRKHLQLVSGRLRTFSVILVVLSMILGLLLYYFFRQREELNLTKIEQEVTIGKLKEEKKLTAASQEELIRSKDVLAGKLQELEKSERTARNKSRETLAQKLLNDSATAKWRKFDHELATLLSLQAYRLHEELGPDKDPERLTQIEQALRRALQSTPFVRGLYVPEVKRRHDKSNIALAHHSLRYAIQTQARKISLWTHRDGTKGPWLKPFPTVGDDIRQLSFSPRDRYLIVVAESGLELLPLTDDSTAPAPPPLRLPSEPKPAGLTCMTEDEKLLAATLKDGRIRVWRLPSNESMDLTATMRKPPTALACDPTGNWIAAGTGDGQVVAWRRDGSHYAEAARFSYDIDKWPDESKTDLKWLRDALEFGVSELCFLPDPFNWLISVHRHGPLRIYDLKNPRTSAYVTHNDASEARLRVSEEQGLATRQIVRKPRVLHADLDPVQKRLYVGGDRGLIGVWDLAGMSYQPDRFGGRVTLNGQPLYASYREYKGLESAVESINVADGGGVLTAADASPSIRQWSFERPIAAAYTIISFKDLDVRQEAGTAYVLQFIDGGKRLVYGNPSAISFLDFDRSNMTLKKSDGLLPFPGSFRAAALSPDGALLAVAGKFPPKPLIARNEVWLFDLTHPRYRHHILGSRHTDGIWGVDVDRSRGIAVSGAYDTNAFVWRPAGGDTANLDWKPGPPLRHQSPVLTVALHPQKALLATGTKEGRVHIWKLDAKDNVGIALRASAFPIRSIRFSADGKDLLAGGDDDMLRVWKVDEIIQSMSQAEAKEEPQLVSIQARSGGVNASVFCDEKLVTVGNKGQINVWNWPITHRDWPAFTLEGPTSEITSVTCSPGSEFFAAGDAEGNVHIWSLGIDRVVEAACRMIWRNLSWKEWRQYLGDDETYDCVCGNVPPDSSVPPAMIKQNGRCSTEATSSLPQ